jgi:hypothetical protein
MRRLSFTLESQLATLFSVKFFTMSYQTTSVGHIGFIVMLVSLIRQKHVRLLEKARQILMQYAQSTFKDQHHLLETKHLRSPP